MNGVLELAGVSVSRGDSDGLGQRLSGLAAEPAVSGVVPGAHHLDDVPLGFTHLLLSRGWVVTAQGRLADVQTGGHPCAAFGLALTVTRAARHCSATAL